MKKIFLFILPLFLACNGNPRNSEGEQVDESSNIAQEEFTPVTTYYFIRHAEKDRSNPEDKDPALTEEGKERAEKWVEVFRDIPLDLVYSSDYKRTRQTSAPVAEDHNLEVEIYDPGNVYDDDFKDRTEGKTVLVVGHSNTNPHFVNKIIGEEKYENIPDDENGSLFIVIQLPNGKTTSKVLYIN